MDYNLIPNHWESNFFGREIHIVQFEPSPKAEKKCTKTALLQAKIPVSNPEQLAFLQQQGFQLVETELQFRLALYPKYVRIESLDLTRPYTVITPAEPIDIDTLQTEFSSAFAHSRFRPPYFSAEENQRFYQKWIENAVKGEFDDGCWIEKTLDGQLQGMLSLKTEGSKAHIGLLAVSSASQRQGVATRLVQHAKQQAKAQGAKHLFVRTQLSNSAAVAFYQAIGAELVESYYWLYRKAE